MYWFRWLNRIYNNETNRSVTCCNFSIRRHSLVTKGRGRIHTERRKLKILRTENGANTRVSARGADDNF